MFFLHQRALTGHNSTRGLRSPPRSTPDFGSMMSRTPEPRIAYRQGADRPAPCVTTGRQANRKFWLVR